MRLIDVPNVSAINAEALHAALKAQSAKFTGIAFDGQLRLVIQDDTDAPTILALVTSAQAHNPATLTPEQQVLISGKTDSEQLLGRISQALADIATKRTAFNTTPNLTTAGALLLELAQDVEGLLKFARYTITRNP